MALINPSKTFEENLEDIAHADYGKEVRPAMHDGLLQMADITGSAAADALAAAASANTAASAAEDMASAAFSATKTAMGGPVEADTAAEMVDTNQIYVYRGTEVGYQSGHWYYYNASVSTWADGGEYKDIVTDPTLTISGAAADAYRTGERIAAYTGNIPIAFTSGGYIATNKSVGDTVSYDVVSNNAFSHAIVNCSENDSITLNGTGWTTGRLWCFVDSEDKVLSVSAASVIADNLVITAPANTAKCIINMYTAYAGICFIGVSTKTLKDYANTEISGLNTRTEKLEQDMDNLVKYVHTEYTNYGIGQATGVPSPASYSVFTGYIKFDNFVEAVKPAGYASRYAFYDADFNMTGTTHDASYNVAYTRTHDSVEVYKTEDSVYIAFAFTKYVDGGTATFPVSEVPTSGIVVKEQTTATIYDLENDVLEIRHELNDQYFNLSNMVLTESLTFNVSMGQDKYKNMIISHYAMYEAAEGVTDRPYIYVSRDWKNSAGSYNNYYNSPRYYIGDLGQYVNRQCRIPPFMNDCRDYVTVRVVIPAGITLHIKTLCNSYDDMISRSDSGIHLNAHGTSGFGGPGQTLIQFEMAARLGYRYCITIPKVTSDGVYVCLHDDDSIQGTARNDDGSQIAAEYRDRPVSTFTYNELLQFDFGIVRGLPFKGERIPLLADFFKICARTGMHPMLSVHPSLSGHWDNIKALAKKYGVLDKLNIKSDKTNIEVPMQVLLDDIESYTIDDSTGGSNVARFDTLKARYNLSKARCVIEYNYAVITDALIADVLSGGYECACFNIGNNMGRVLSLIEKGVHEFTEDFNCSVGLNW